MPDDVRHHEPVPRISRRTVVAGIAGLVGGAAALARAGTAASAGAPPARKPGARERIAPSLGALAVRNSGTPFAGDHALLATVVPGAAGGRASARITFRLDRAARVEVQALTTRDGLVEVVWQRSVFRRAGTHTIEWRPPAGLPARTYLIRLSVRGREGTERVYGASRRPAVLPPRSPVVRVLGVEGAFLRRSYAPGQRGRLRIECDASEVVVRILRCGHEDPSSPGRRDAMDGAPVADDARIDWRAQRDRPGVVPITMGDWPTGLYVARLETPDGRLGFAPFVLRPAQLGASRTAVVLPTHTWQAYNFRDRDGDGWGDTWYAGGNPPVALDRPHLDRGVPFRYAAYDLQFLRWLANRGRPVDFLAQDDVEEIGRGERLRSLYDLIVYPGHTEYVTRREYDAVERYRDLGGSLWFLSANNFFWEVERRRGRLHRTQLWRELGRPEAGLIGVQYRANDDGSVQDSFVVTGAEAAPWLFEGTGVVNGRRFGTYGIEIDARTPASPPGTIVLATIPELYGTGFTAEMTYYETPAGAKVFAGGALNFGGTANRFIVGTMLDNLWNRVHAAPPA